MSDARTLALAFRTMANALDNGLDAPSALRAAAEELYPDQATCAHTEIWTVTTELCGGDAHRQCKRCGMTWPGGAL